ncbi:hypothetical protein VTL71DRAFT_208 [Oculimacula yallundae]|uniref:Uncharacterized protein n=1 Tax=Oculimacula yallundae TaxID=86028 RepID=A0ABR4CZB6_9HELO
MIANSFTHENEIKLASEGVHSFKRSTGQFTSIPLASHIPFVTSGYFNWIAEGSLVDWSGFFTRPISIHHGLQ